MDSLYLTNGAIDPGLIAKRISVLSNNKKTGGHSIFLGQVRDDDIDGKRVVAIEYSAYEEMVEKEAARITETVKNAFSDVHEVTIVHATGKVEAGALSLFVLVTAGHRNQAMRACRHVVEMIKENYPVWKKELFQDNTSRWKENE